MRMNWGCALVGRIFLGDRIFKGIGFSHYPPKKKQKKQTKTNKVSCLKCCSSTFSKEKAHTWWGDGGWCHFNLNIFS